jgi:prephenate dehydrogenase
MLFNKIAIVGTGLIGGSIALALKEKQLARIVIGVSRHKESLILARKLGAIDSGSQDINIIKDADLVILATPVTTIIKSACRISKILKPECIICDVGSTKEQIVSKLTPLIPHFVGCHPLSGSEKKGIKNAFAGLFKNSLCILTPVKNTDNKALTKVKKLWVNLGAKVITMNPKFHDQVLSFVSHLPHLVSFALINSISPSYFRFSASSLKDTTRIAASDSGLWLDIFFSNRDNILRAAQIFEQRVSAIKEALAKKDKKLLRRILTKAKNNRKRLD